MSSQWNVWVIAVVIAVVIALGGLVVVASAVGVGVGMGIGMADIDEVVCSPMRGQLVDATGAPVTGVTVTRRWDWRGTHGEDEAVTDAEGRFAFDAVPAQRGFFGRLPAQVAVNQTFRVALPGRPFEFLSISTRSLDLHAETGGPDFDVVCRTGVEPGFDGLHWGTCTLRE